MLVYIYMYMYVTCAFLLYEHTCMCVLTSRLGKAGGGAVDVPFAVSVCMALFMLYLETITNYFFSLISRWQLLILITLTVVCLAYTQSVMAVLLKRYH